MKEYGKYLMVTALCIGSLLLAASFFDLQLARALYDPQNLFGRIGEAYGQLPAEMVVSLCGVIFILCSRAGLDWVLPARYLGFVGVACIVGAIVCDAVRAGLVFDGGIAWRLGLSALLIALADVALYGLLRNVETAKLLHFAQFCLFVLAAEIVLVNPVLKELWQRPRPRVLAANPGLDFQPWWNIGCSQRADYLARGVIRDGFRSFPSGHTANAACALLLAALPLVLPSLERWWGPLYLMGVAVAFLVALSRMVVGAHFLSDVTVGYAITLTATIVGYRIFYCG